MKKYKKMNKQLSETMKTHLIIDLDDFGVWSNNYEQFIEKRARVVSNEIENRIIKQDIDKNPQADLIDDYEHDEHETEIE